MTNPTDNTASDAAYRGYARQDIIDDKPDSTVGSYVAEHRKQCGWHAAGWFYLADVDGVVGGKLVGPRPTRDAAQADADVARTRDLAAIDGRTYLDWSAVYRYAKEAGIAIIGIADYKDLVRIVQAGYDPFTTNGA